VGVSAQQRGRMFGVRAGKLLRAVICLSILLITKDIYAQSLLSPEQRAQTFLAGRSMGGASVARGMQAARAQHAALVAQQSQRLTVMGGVSTTWTAVGPVQIASANYGLETGRVTSIAIDPSDASGNTVYVGTTGGGVWKSVNAAGPASRVSFVPLTDTLSAYSSGTATASLSIGALAVQPAGTGVVLAGTGDPNDATDSYYGSGILRTADGGQTWTLIQASQDGLYGIHLFTGEGFAGFAWSTATQGLVVAAASQAAEGTIVNDEYSGASARGLYYSTDAGATWQMATISDGSQVVQSAATTFGSFYGNAVTAVVWNPVRQMFYAAVRFHGYYQSADGMNWTRLANQPGAGLTTANCPVHPGQTGSTNCPIFRGALAVNPATGDTFALTVDQYNLNQGLWQDACQMTSGKCASGTIAFANKLNAAPLETSSTNTAIAQGDYNLTLAAVASGSDTLLFAGTTDIYRCSLSGGCALRNTTNSVDGCTTPAGVAPSQHVIATMSAPSGIGGPLLYFGNDGGLWRSVDGVAETGSVCSSTDAAHYQNLNGGLGSLAEVAHFSQSPSNGTTYIVGLGALGTAATASSTTQTAWPQLSAGEGGYNAIDTANPNNWYISTGAGVNINQCTLGTSCTAANFAVQATISATQTAGDNTLTGNPFMADPGDTANLIVGTCRVWRGVGSGGWTTSNLVSAILDGVSNPECTTANGAVRALAAGGLVNSGSGPHAGSETFYAGLAGAVDGGGLKGGHLFSTTAGATATSTTTWSDLWLSPVTNDPNNNITTGDAQFNPGDFDVSSIAIDPHDTTGQTVYVGIMGFNNNGIQQPHLYYSIDGGAHWTTITSNLPNAPVNSVVVDPNNANTVYVGMDTGVYATSSVSACAATNSACWTVMGAGLPNAPVTEQTAVTGAAAGGEVTGMLTASTYGRGLWQVPLLTATLAAQPMPAITLSTSPLTFAAQQVQTSSSMQVVTVTNTGTAALTISQVAITGDFSETDNCTKGAIAVNGSCTVNVVFTPVATGARTGTLTIFGNVSGGQAQVSLSGIGLAPAAVTITPASLSFASTLVGATSAAQSLVVANTGGVSATMQTPFVTGDFAVSGNSCGTSLAAQSSCTVTVIFTPTTSGTRSGSFGITDGAGTQTAALVGTGLAKATDTLSPTTLTFAAQTVGTTSTAQTVTLTNSGDQTLASLNVNVTGDFSVVSGCSGTLAGHSTCSIAVSYTPKAIGAESGTISIVDALRTQTMTLSGTGLAPAGVSLVPTSLSFGNLGVGLTGVTQSITLTNNGGSPLAISSVTASGDFLLSGNNCPATLAAGGNCTLAIKFAPTATGTRSGTLTVTDSAIGSPHTVMMGGVGVDFALAASGSTMQTVSGSGGTTGYALMLTPAAGLTGTLAISCSGAPAHATCIVSPTIASLSSGQTLIQVNIGTAIAYMERLQLPGRLTHWAPVLALLLLPTALLRRRRLTWLLLIAAVLPITACGAGREIPPNSTQAASSNPTPAGTYTLTVSANDSVSLAQHAVSLTLVVQ